MDQDETVDPEAQPTGETPSLPDALQQEILTLHAGPMEVRAGKIDELCRRHAEHAEDIRGFVEALERAAALAPENEKAGQMLEAAKAYRKRLP